MTTFSLSFRYVLGSPKKETALEKKFVKFFLSLSEILAEIKNVFFTYGSPSAVGLPPGN